MNFEIRRLKDMKLILRLFTLWVFVQILRDLVSYSVLMTWFPDTMIYKVVQDTGYPKTTRAVFIAAVVFTLPYFLVTLFNVTTKLNRTLARMAVFSMFIMVLKWVLLIPSVFRVEGGGTWICIVYVGNMLEVAALAGAIAWNMNQHLKYESDYGLIPKVPDTTAH